MPRLLSTKKLTKAQQNLILNQGWNFVEYNAIQLTPTYKASFFKGFYATNAIVTSPFAASILLHERPKIDQLFVVGEKTSQQLSQHYKIKEVASYGADLASIICAKYSTEKFVFLCGKLRKDDIPKQLKAAHILLEEYPIYSTNLSLKTIPGEFDAVLLFSPSAVKSYFASHQLNENTTYICIGTSTAKEASKYTHQFKIASQPSIESCIVALKTIQEK
jgi:uroporphyrinogen-III synthase